MACRYVALIQVAHALHHAAGDKYPELSLAFINGLSDTDGLPLGLASRFDLVVHRLSDPPSIT